MNNKKIRIGVMGCANIAKRSVIPAILELPELFELVAIASRGDKAQAFAKDFNCEAVVGYDALLERDDIDAIYMPLPTGLHKEWITKTLQSGKSIYAEKSIAMNYADASEMVALAKEKNLPLMEGYMFVHHPQHQVVKDILASGKLGDIRHFTASFGFPPFPDPTNFRYDNQIGGGALKDAAGYVVKATRLLLPTELVVKASSVHYDDATGTSLYGSAYLADQNGLGASVSFGFDHQYQCNYSIWGSKGKLTALKSFTPRPQEDTHLLLECGIEKEDIVVPAANHFVHAFKHFYALHQEQDKRTQQYDEILTQSKDLDLIEELSKA